MQPHCGKLRPLPTFLHSPASVLPQLCGACAAACIVLGRRAGFANAIGAGEQGREGRGDRSN